MKEKRGKNRLKTIHEVFKRKGRSSTKANTSYLQKKELGAGGKLKRRRSVRGLYVKKEKRNASGALLRVMSAARLKGKLIVSRGQPGPFAVDGY